MSDSIGNDITSLLIIGGVTSLAICGLIYCYLSKDDSSESISEKKEEDNLVEEETSDKKSKKRRNKKKNEIEIDESKESQINKPSEESLAEKLAPLLEEKQKVNEDQENENDVIKSSDLETSKSAPEIQPKAETSPEVKKDGKKKKKKEKEKSEGSKPEQSQAPPKEEEDDQGEWVEIGKKAKKESTFQEDKKKTKELHKAYLNEF